MREYLKPYEFLLTSFINGQIQPIQFEKEYIALFQDHNTELTEAEHSLIEAMFFTVEDFCSDPTLREAGDLDEHQLLAEAKKTLSSLKNLKEAKENIEFLSKGVRGDTKSHFISLIESFVKGEVRAKDFKTAYIAAFLDLPSISNEEEYAIFKGLFSDAQEYCTDPELREDGDVNETQLLTAAHLSLAALKKVNSTEKYLHQQS